MITNLSWGEVQVRKDHSCFGCCTKIRKGDRAIRSTVVDDGIFTHHLCLECDKFLKEHSRDFDDGFTEGQIGEAREEYIRETAAGV